MVAQIDREYWSLRPTKALCRVVGYSLYEGRPITTRGRWINPVVSKFLSLQRNLLRIQSVQAPIFIVGNGRSGTTILGTILSMHPDVGFLNEPKAIWHKICEYEDIVGNYARGEARYRLDENDASKRSYETAQRLFGAYLFITRSKRLVDKYPELVFRMPFVKAIFPDAKFVLLTRNAYDTVTSIANWASRYTVRVKGEIHGWWGVDNRKWRLMVDQVVDPDPELAEVAGLARMLNRPEDMAAVEWVVTIREGLKREHSFGDSILRVKYENLIQDPETALRRILEFCDLPADHKVLQYGLSKLHRPSRWPGCTIHSALLPYIMDAMASVGYGIGACGR